MSETTQQLLALEPEVNEQFADGKVDYRGYEITPFHVMRYLHADLYRIEEIIRLVEQYSQPGATVLDVGMGYGFYDLLLKRYHQREVVGLELEGNIPFYCGLAEKWGIKIVPGGLAAEGLPLDDTSFDFVILSEVFEHLRVSPLAALTEIGRVLKPDGRLLLTTPNIARLINIAYLALGRNILEPLPDDTSRLTHVTDALAHIREYTMNELVELMERAGFSVLEKHYSRCWDQYNPYRMAGRSLMAKLARRGLSAATWLMPSMRSDLMLVGQKGTAS